MDKGLLVVPVESVWLKATVESKLTAMNAINNLLVSRVKQMKRRLCTIG
jgi:hypothetical protein